MAIFKAASILALAVVVGFADLAQARDFFVDPSWQDGGNGSKSAPYNNLQTALSASGVSGGDQIVLSPGEYGDVRVGGAQFQTKVMISAPSGQVHFQSLTVNNSKNLSFAGLAIWPDNPQVSEGSLVQTSGNSSSISFDDLDVRSHRDALNYRSWGLEKWQSTKRRGVLLRGVRNSIRNSQVTGVFIGISAIGDHALISGNHVSGFSGDALRALGDYSLVSGNYVEDCIKINRNHDDGFQSWSRGPNGKTGNGIVRGLTIENNIILEWNGRTEHPLRCSLQGIGLFDGLFESLVIQNNLVSVSAYHGIAVAGGRDSRIVNNTVINASGEQGKSPWISVAHHKNGTAPMRVIVANNAAMSFRMTPEISRTADSNVSISDPRQLMNDPYGNDFRPRPGSALSGKANPNYAPEHDILGVSRRESVPDIGAFQGR